MYQAQSYALQKCYSVELIKYISMHTHTQTQTHPHSHTNTHIHTLKNTHTQLTISKKKTGLVTITSQQSTQTHRIYKYSEKLVWLFLSFFLLV